MNIYIYICIYLYIGTHVVFNNILKILRGYQKLRENMDLKVNLLSTYEGQL